MTRDEKIAEARRLRSEGRLYREIGEQLGVHRVTALAWCNPERTQAQNRKSNAKRRAAKQDWEDRQRAECPSCGEPMSSGSALRGGPDPDSVCASCSKERSESRLRSFVALREQGMTNVEIANHTGISTAAVANAFCRAKREGFDVPPSPYFVSARCA